MASLTGRTTTSRFCAPAADEPMRQHDAPIDFVSKQFVQVRARTNLHAIDRKQVLSGLEIDDAPPASAESLQ